MALEDIFRALEEQAEQECQELLADARDQAEGIVEEAQDEAEEIRKRLVSDTERATRLKASQSVNSARLETKKKVASLKQEAVAKAFEKALEQAGSIRKSDSYAKTFRALAEEAAEGLEGEMTVLVDPADADLAARTFSDMGVTAEVATEIETVGGLVIVTGGGLIKRRNTFEDRLEKVQHLIQADVAEIMFS